MGKVYKFVKEEKWNNKEDIEISDEFYNEIIRNDVKIAETQGQEIKFIYVGVIAYNREILVVLPKYYSGVFYNELECIITLIKVFKKIPKGIISANKDILFISRDIESEYISEIAIADFIIKDFILNGYYIKTEERNNLNSGGSIDWSKTVNSVQPLLSRGYPIYDNVYNTDIIEDANNEIIKIYNIVLEYCIAMYSELLDYNFGRIRQVNLYKNINRIGSLSYILSIIQNELNYTYNEREINLLKAMYYFFKPSKKSSLYNLSLYGTNSFDYIWEYVCGFVFGNQYEELSKFIPIPQWKSIGGREVENKRNKLNPDILRVHNDVLLILDGKYYMIELTDEKIDCNPGTYDIIKQYTYEHVFRKKGFNCKIINALLYPKEIDKLYEVFGTVRFEAFDMNPILNIYISPDIIWNMYLKNVKIDDNKLDEFISDSFC